MNKIIRSLILTLICISCCVMLFSCALFKDDEQPVNPINYTVTFLVEGKVYSTDLVNADGAVVKPFKDPVKKNHKFTGWSTVANEYKPYDFNSKMTKSLTLHAYFVYDKEGMVQEIDRLSSSIVQVSHTYKENGEEKLIEGVGYVYLLYEGYCFVVTNYHTVISNENQTDPRITAIDKEGNEFEAFVFKHQNKENPALDKEYDLALLCFPYEGAVLKANEYTAIIDYMGEDVIAITSKEQVATGKATDYKKVTVNIDESLSSIDFEVYCHNAIPDSGVNESILYNLESQLIGLTYYAEDGIAYTIPQGRIAMFLNE